MISSLEYPLLHDGLILAIQSPHQEILVLVHHLVHLVSQYPLLLLQGAVQLLQHLPSHKAHTAQKNKSQLHRAHITNYLPGHTD